MPAKLQQIVAYLDKELRTAEVGDWPAAHNGLQCDNGGTVTRIAAAVDACEAVIDAAADAGADLLIVHHGLFWGGGAPWTGARYRKLERLIKSGMALYSSHLPLDLHAQLGNNALLAKALGLKSAKPFFEEFGGKIGRIAEVRISREVLHRRLEAAVGGPVHLAPGGPATIRRIGVVTGGAGGEVAKVAAEGVDTFVTGEGPHHTYTLAEELGVNLFYAGHYATETFGVKACAERLSARFKIPWGFIDHPTGL